MPKVLVVSHAIVTAINRNVYKLLQDKGWQVEMLMPDVLLSHSKPIAAQPAREGDPKIHLRKMTGTNLRLYSYEGLDRLLDEVKPDAVFLDNDPVSKLAIQIGAWCRKNNKKLLCQSCENLPFTFMASVKRNGWSNAPAAIIKLLMAYQAKNKVDAVLTINKDGKKIFEDFGFKYVVQTPLGFDPAIFKLNNEAKTAIKEKLQLNGIPVLAYFGRMVQEKGIHLLLEALAQLKHHQWKLLLDQFDMDATPYHQQIASLIEKHGLQNRIIYIHANHNEIANYMAATDLTILPSITTSRWMEQYGRVVPEAMACGSMVAVSDSGSLPDLTNSHAIVFKQNNIPSLVQAIERFLANPESFLTKAKEGANYVQEQLSIPAQVKVLDTVLRKCIQ
jgi:glycosyltransferase involved in cell wall biosynthesis